MSHLDSGYSFLLDEYPIYVLFYRICRKDKTSPMYSSSENMLEWPVWACAIICLLCTELGVTESE